MQDLAEGLIPFYLCGTIGTTSSCAVDPIKDLAPVAQQHGMWCALFALHAALRTLHPQGRSCQALGGAGGWGPCGGLRPTSGCSLLTTLSHAVLRCAAPAAVLRRLHVDSAWAGVYGMLPEVQEQGWFQGLELADSFDTNPHKGLLTNFDWCAARAAPAGHALRC